MSHSSLSQQRYAGCALGFRQEHLRLLHAQVLQVLPNHLVFTDLTDGALFDFFGEYGPNLETTSAIESRILNNLFNETAFVQSEGIAAPGAETLVIGIRTCARPIHIFYQVLVPTMPDGTVIDLEALPNAAAIDWIGPDNHGCVTPQNSTS